MGEQVGLDSAAAAPYTSFTMTPLRRNIILITAGLLLVVGVDIWLMSVPPYKPASPEDPQQQAASTPAPPAEAAPVEATIYSADMTQEPGEEWNDTTLGKTPKGGRPFLGPFSPRDKAILTLNKMPPHKMVRITFDLFVLYSWDGSSPIWGPCVFNCGLKDGRSLVHSSFCNCGFFNNNNEQSFPDSYPSRPFPAWTLAKENQVLGYMQDWGDGDGPRDCSSVYHMVLTFPHAEDAIAFVFTSDSPQNIKKVYGLTNVRVETMPELKTFTAEQLAALWSDLGEDDPAASYNARWNLIAAGEPAVDFIGRHVDEIHVPARAPGPHPFPATDEEIKLQRARDVLDAIHSPAALQLKNKIPQFEPGQ